MVCTYHLCHSLLDADFISVVINNYGDMHSGSSGKERKI